MAAKVRVAKSLETLRKQLNELFPDRDKASDGGVGDAAHSKRKSDHNPNGAGVVTARDFTNDTNTLDGIGIDCKRLAEVLFKHKDPRIKYLIFARKITKPGLTGWKTYSGANAHLHHLHISVASDAKLYDDDSLWNLDGLVDKNSAVVSAPFQTTDSPSISVDSPAVVDKPVTFNDPAKPEQLPIGQLSETPPAPEAIPVPQVSAETGAPKEVSGIKASLAGAVTFITTSCMGILTWLGGVAWQIVAVLAAAAIIVGIIYLINRFWFANKEKQREHELTKEREKQAFELQKLTLESAMRKDLNTVKIVPTPIQNSEAK